MRYALYTEDTKSYKEALIRADFLFLGHSRLPAGKAGLPGILLREGSKIPGMTDKIDSEIVLSSLELASEKM